MSKAKRKPLPKFGTEEQERKFWAAHEPAEFVDWSSAQSGHFLPCARLYGRSH